MYQVIDFGNCTDNIQTIELGILPQSGVELTGSFTVTWFIPVTVIETLTKKRALDIIKEFNITRL